MRAVLGLILCGILSSIGYARPKTAVHFLQWQGAVFIRVPLATNWTYIMPGGKQWYHHGLLYVPAGSVVLLEIHHAKKRTRIEIAGPFIGKTDNLRNIDASRHQYLPIDPLGPTVDQSLDPKSLMAIDGQKARPPDRSVILTRDTSRTLVLGYDQLPAGTTLRISRVGGKVHFRKMDGNALEVAPGRYFWSLLRDNNSSPVMRFDVEDEDEFVIQKRHLNHTIFFPSSFSEHIDND